MTVISVTLGRMDEKLGNIDSRLNKQDVQIARLTTLITGNGSGEGLIPNAMRTNLELESLRERCRSYEHRLTVLETDHEDQKKVLDHARQMFMENPPLLWLARFRTKQTVAIIVVVFIILSLWWVSSWRGFFLELLGIPPF